MSKSKPKINPEDVFPRRNLPGAAEQWGRAVEDRTRELEKNAVAVNQSLRGANRGTAAQLANISDQLTLISRVTKRVSETNDYFLHYDTLDSNTSMTVAEFNIPSPVWATHGVVSASFGVNPDGLWGSTTRTAVYSVYVTVADSASLGQINLLAGSGRYNGDRWEPVESHLISTSEGWARGFINREVTSGSGTIYPLITVSVTWYGSPLVH